MVMTSRKRLEFSELFGDEDEVFITNDNTWTKRGTLNSQGRKNKGLRLLTSKDGFHQ